MAFSIAKTLAFAALAATASADTTGLKLCKLPNYNLQAAAQLYPELTKSINTVLDQGVATWYTDRVTDAEHQDFLKRIKSTCASDETMLIAVYGLPQKDCADGYSSSGGNRNNADYVKWITDLANAVGNQKVIYVYEPDALALTIDGKCGMQYEYIPNIQSGLPILTKNPNAKLYMDVGYWTLQWPALITQIIDHFKLIESYGKITGITIGTSNYRPIKEMVGLCNNFTREYGSAKYNCILDTSRDYSDTVPGTDWCNQMWAGVGHPSTGATGYDNIDAFLWVKPVGESDGTCNGGPVAGQFWYDGFVKWWNQGWFVLKEGWAKLGPQPNTPVPTLPATTTTPTSTTATPAPSGTTQTPAPSSTTATPAPSSTTKTPTPSSTTATPAPTTTKPASGGAKKWEQCGGINWQGVTTCAEGTCTKLNDYYYQCL